MKVFLKSTIIVFVAVAGVAVTVFGVLIGKAAWELEAPPKTDDFCC